MKIISIKPTASRNSSYDAYIEVTKGKDTFMFNYVNQQIVGINNPKLEARILKKCEKFCRKYYGLSLEHHIRINKLLYQISQNLFCEPDDEYDDGISSSTEIADTLPEGWYWNKYSDGSGSLRDPNGEDVFSYDLATGEYWDYFGKIHFMPNYPLPTNFPEYKAFAEKEIRYILKTKCAA